MRGRNARGAMLVTLMALGVMLLAPSVSQAHVRAAYRADYKHRLAALKQVFNVQATHFDNMKQGVLDTVDTMRPMLNDPDKHEELVAQEEWAHDVWLTLAALPSQYEKTWDKMAKAFISRRTLYFARRRDQREFEYQATWVKIAGDLLVKQAMEHVVDAYFWLGGEPLDLDRVMTAAIAEADSDAASAHETFDLAVPKVRGML
jgi:hypothetical protein